MEEEEDSVQRRKHGSSSKGTLRDGLRGKKIFKAYDAEEVQEKLHFSSCNRSVTLHHIPDLGMFLLDIESIFEPWICGYFSYTSGNSRHTREYHILQFIDPGPTFKVRAGGVFSLAMQRL